MKGTCRTKLISYGNGIESYKIRDSVTGKPILLGNRVTTVSAQDYKEVRRFADLTYSGVYNDETNVNKLNEFTCREAVRKAYRYPHVAGG
jgi:hypothetical protein